MSGGATAGGTSELNLFFICLQPNEGEEVLVFAKKKTDAVMRRSSLK